VHPPRWTPSTGADAVGCSSTEWQEFRDPRTGPPRRARLSGNVIIDGRRNATRTPPAVRAAGASFTRGSGAKLVQAVILVGGEGRDCGPR